MAQWTIRRATSADLDMLAVFNQGIAQETENRQLDEATLRAGLTAILNNNSLGFYLVAERDQVVVGSSMVTFEWSDWRNGMFWWIQSVYVVPECRRQGVYRMLYDHIRKQAARENVCGFRLYVERDNQVAQDTYVAMGMHETVYKMYEQLCPSDDS